MNADIHFHSTFAAPAIDESTTFDQYTSLSEIVAFCVGGAKNAPLILLVLSLTALTTCLTGFVLPVRSSSVSLLVIANGLAGDWSSIFASSVVTTGFLEKSDASSHTAFFVLDTLLETASAVADAFSAMSLNIHIVFLL